ncbi:hypothetical protein RJ55_06768 [Drechmeria coniospora]|nr:hypothetical protein RJ55_06768 [Drechmeria coniospora]
MYFTNNDLTSKCFLVVSRLVGWIPTSGCPVRIACEPGKCTESSRTSRMRPVLHDGGGGATVIETDGGWVELLWLPSACASADDVTAERHEATEEAFLRCAYSTCTYGSGGCNTYCVHPWAVLYAYAQPVIRRRSSSIESHGIAWVAGRCRRSCDAAWDATDGNQRHSTAFAHLRHVTARRHQQLDGRRVARRHGSLPCLERAGTAPPSRKGPIVRRRSAGAGSQPRQHLHGGRVFVGPSGLLDRALRRLGRRPVQPLLAAAAAAAALALRRLLLHRHEVRLRRVVPLATHRFVLESVEDAGSMAKPAPTLEGLHVDLVIARAVSSRPSADQAPSRACIVGVTGGGRRADDKMIEDGREFLTVIRLIISSRCLMSCSILCCFYFCFISMSTSDHVHIVRTGHGRWLCVPRPCRRRVEARNRFAAPGRVQSHQRPMVVTRRFPSPVTDPASVVSRRATLEMVTTWRGATSAGRGRREPPPSGPCGAHLRPVAYVSNLWRTSPTCGVRLQPVATVSNLWRASLTRPERCIIAGHAGQRRFVRRAQHPKVLRSAPWHDAVRLVLEFQQGHMTHGTAIG